MEDGLQASADNIERTASPEEREKLLRALRDSRRDQQKLHDLLRPLFLDVGEAALHCIKELLPHQRGDGSTNEERYNAYRFRVLNASNGNHRFSKQVIKDFVVHQVFEPRVVFRIVTKGHGPFNLPRGVKMPGEKQQPGTQPEQA